MHFVSKIDWAHAQTPQPYEGRSSGFRRATYVGPGMGSVHMGVGVCSLEPGGLIQTHLHSFEESFYVLEGNLIGQIGEKSCALGPGNYGLIGTGVRHGWRNAGTEPVRWLEMQAPQPRPADSSRDTFFVAGEIPQHAAAADGDQRIGHFDESQLPRPGGPSQMEGFNPTTGVAIKMFVDRSFGAIHQSLFLIQYMPGAKIDTHDHTFEESYLIVSGRVRATADGKQYDLGPGDVIWTSVGCIHSFANVGPEPVRWIETQAPLPPAKEVFRFERDWAQYDSVSAGNA
jgi:mannose-6-phosphate isomerase-like protein (cupin superfamily)